MKSSELQNSKINFARNIKNTKLLSKKWIYKNIFNMSDDEIRKEMLKNETKKI